MPFVLVSVPIVRSKATTKTATGYSGAAAAVPGSPFQARVYRVAQVAVNRDEAAAGSTTVDATRRIAIYDPACPVKAGDIATLPEADGTTTQAKVLRKRSYTKSVQYDLETGAE